MNSNENQLSFIYWFASYNRDSPSVRYRAEYPLISLKENFNIKSILITPTYRPKGILRFMGTYIWAFFFRKKNSLIVVQRVRSNFIYANLLKLLISIHKRNTVYDLDDADYLMYSSGTINWFLQHCSTISAGSNAIAEYTKDINKNTWLTPSPTLDLGIEKKKRNPVFTIGWIGGFHWGHKPSLVSSLFPAIKELPFKVVLIFLGVEQEGDVGMLEEYFKDCKNVTLEIPSVSDWRDELHIQEQIAKFDLGIATLSDNEIQRSKSGIKVKQYLNNGIPVLSSDLPENNLYVKNGYNGFLCKNSTEFKDRIIDIKQLEESDYIALSRNARNSISEFNHDLYLSIFQSMFR